MIIVLNGNERRSMQREFLQLFRLRHEIFVKGRGWSLPTVNGQEIDQYDNDEAVYFLDIDENDAIQGSVRITPTVRSSLLADYFPHLVENGLSPRSPQIYECTRYIVLPSQKSREANRAAKSRLLSAMMEWSLARELAYVQTVIDSATLSTFVELTPLTVPLGLPHPYGGGRGTPGGGECMAIRWPVTFEVLNDLRAYGGVDPHPSMPIAPLAERPPVSLH
jgi:acyl-homoserine lactone synthase